jgi:UDP-glucose-4-epimerase GalE
MSNILVVGGAGYVGSHTCKALALAGYNPVVLDNLSSGHRWAVRWGPLIEGDAADRKLIRHTVLEHDIRAVLHFAAIASVAESVQHPRKYFSENVATTLHLLAALLETPVRTFVFSSTCATYGIPTEIPITENCPQVPVNPYGESKLFIEKTLHWYGEAYGLSHVSLRYFNAAGADPDGEIGEDHDPETHLVPLTIRTALGQREELDIFGADHQTPDGSAIRDYTHVADLADAHVRALEYLSDDGLSTAFNLGTGQGSSVRDVIRTVEEVSGARVRRRHRPRRPGDPAFLVAQADRANKVLGWEPRFKTLEPIVRTAWHWHSRGLAQAEPVTQEDWI